MSGQKKSIPNDEIVWETYVKDGNEKYIVTSKKTRDAYFIYEVSEGGYNKVGKAKTPPELDRYIKEVWRSGKVQ